MSQIVGLVVLPNDGRPGNLRTRTNGILSSRLVPGSWQSPRRALRGPRTTENTGLERCRSDGEDSEDGLLSMRGKIDGVLEAEKKRGRSYLAAVLVNTRPNQFVKYPACTI